MTSTKIKQLALDLDVEFTAGSPFTASFAADDPGVLFTSPTIAYRTKAGTIVSGDRVPALVVGDSGGPVINCVWSTACSAANNTRTDKVAEVYTYEVRALVNGLGPYPIFGGQVIVWPTGVATTGTATTSERIGTVNVGNTVIEGSVLSGNGLASGVQITDVDGLFTATQVEAALRELAVGKANIASPTFTGNPTAPTPSTSDNDTSIATTAFVQSVAALRVNRTEVATAIVNGFTDTAIQAAITASGWPANPAYIICPPGTYTFTTGVTVDGSGALSTPELEFSGRGVIFRTTTPNCTLFTLTNSVVSLTRVVFNDILFNTNANPSTAVTLNNAQLCTFNNCTFTGNFATAIRLTGTSTYNAFVGCHFGDLRRGIHLVSGVADYLLVQGCAFNEKLDGNPLNWIHQDVSSAATVGVRIVENTFYGSQATLHQVRLMHVNGAMIANNTFAYSEVGAVYIGAGGTADNNSIVGNVFVLGGNGDDIYLHGSNRCVISNNLFGPPAAALSVPADTYANIRIRDPFTSNQGSGCVVMGNVSRATATQITSVVHADATCQNLAVIGNVGAAGVVAAHASNQLVGNIAA